MCPVWSQGLVINVMFVFLLLFSPAHGLSLKSQQAHLNSDEGWSDVETSIQGEGDPVLVYLYKLPYALQ